ncbi:putative cold-shock DNA-binding protein [Mucilaginibacter yixingensis]|uniref:Putative cold-shock DNA-binding protein n=1 Tax=Mucilaginibacter yixingensis TaxID=1295612 RepID=A0A2T5JFD6_9SPHI|nr:cold shock domain-containing protein [Mucilaginibacter yixingensis]PTR01115.1 putative cold-shock DNA-binding protein [Mucilaginibacter yixingensis]
MGRSNETFSKKEKEKKRLKKQQNKKDKTEERKASSSKGKSLEDMMAYVDADGNITSTPPDLHNKRKEIALEDIQLGAAKQIAMPEDAVRKGVVTLFNEQKGFGFIRDEISRESIFVHVSDVTGIIRENDRVTYEPSRGQKGPAAIKVAKI